MEKLTFQSGDGSKDVPVNKTIAIFAEEGDDLSGAEALAKEAEGEAAASNQAEEAKKDESKKEEAKKEESKKEEPKKEAPPKTSSETQPSGGKPLDHVFATPVAKRIALERGIPLLQIKGSGPEGRILKEDVEKYVSGSGAPAAGAAPSQAAAGPSYTDQPISNMRRTIAKRLTESKATLPHYYVTFDIEMDRVLQLRELFNRASAEAANGNAEKAKDAKLSVNDFIVKAAAIALRQVPAANSAWHGDFIREYHTQDISMAVATPNGLITPIIRNCGALGLSDIGRMSKELAKKARDGKLKPEEYQGGSFTISNMGMMGTSHFTAIINPPQSCILAIGASESRLVPDESSEKGFKTVQVMKATISADHRVVDGAMAAQWMQSFKAALENPLSFML